MDILERITQLREERGWSSYKLAKMANIPQSTLSNLFNRENSPTIATLIAICNAFDISLAQFFSEVTHSSLTEEQNELLKNWSLLSKGQKEKVMIYIKGLLQEQV
ncbi:helix-turn-helix domain-containing protein [Geovibrio sp. ADMFC3]